MPDIGGVYLSIGIDISKVKPAMEAAKGQLNQFKRSMAQLRVEGAIKGDPFSYQKKMFKETNKALDNVFKQWKIGVNTTEVVMDKFTKNQMASAEAVIHSWERFFPVWQKMQTAMRGTGAGGGMDLFGGLRHLMISAKTAPGGGVAGTQMDKQVAQMYERLKKTFTGITPEIDAAFKTMEKTLVEGTGNIYERMGPALIQLESVVKKSFGSISREHRQFGEELKRVRQIQEEYRRAWELAVAKSPEAALKRQSKAVHDLRVQEARLRTELQLGIDVRRNKVALMKTLERRYEVANDLTRQEARELRRLKKEYDRTTNARKRMFSKEWLSTRLRWFVQLRLAWEAWRIAGKAMRDVIDWQNQLARAMRTARSEVMSQTQITKEYGDAMKVAVAAHGIGWREAGEALYQFGSAGLSAEESMAALNSTLSLVRGTEGDVREVTKGIAGLYNNFGETITHVSTLQEKFAYINEIVAQTWQRHQVEISELMQGFRMLSAMGRTAGLRFETMAASLGVLNDHMIKSGRAGRSLQNVLMRMSRDPVRFAQAFGIAFDPTKPLNFEEIMGDLSKRMKQGTVSAYELSVAFERLGLRGAPTFVTLVQNWDKVQDSMRHYQSESKRLQYLEEEIMDTLEGRWKQFLGNIRTLVAEAGWIADKLKGILEWARDIAREIRGKKLMEDWMGAEDRQAWWAARSDEEKIAIEKYMDSTRKTFEKMTFKEGFSLENLAVFIKKTGGHFAYKFHEGVVEGWARLWKGDDILGIPSMMMQRAIEGLDPSKMVAFEELKQNEQTKVLLNRLKEKEKMRVHDNQLMMRAGKIAENYANTQEKVHATIKRQHEEVLKMSAAELQVMYEDPNVAMSKKIEYRRKELKLADDALGVQRAYMRETEKEGKLVGPTRVAAFENIAEMMKDRNQKQDQLNKLLREEMQHRKEMHQMELEEIQRTIQATEAEAVSESRNKRLVDLYDKRLTAQDKIHTIDRAMVILDDKSYTNIANKRYETAKTADEQQRIKDIKEDENELDKSNLRMLMLRTKQKQIDLDLELQRMRAVEKNEKKELALRLQISDEKLQEYALEYQQQDNAEARQKILNKIKQEELEIFKLMQRQAEVAKPWLGAFRRMREELRETHQMMEDSIYNFTIGFKEGFGGLMTDATGGFQEQQQEVINLQGELAQLELDYKAALGEGNQERAAEIANEMARLRGEIDDLEDPIHNLREGFRSFFKDLVDQIREAIIKWLIFKAIMMGINALSGGAGAGAGAALQAGGGAMTQVIGLGGPIATGGVRSFKNFRAFARGGMTSGPQLALLGDNKSGAELVIPSENISKDSASGYMRDQEQPINVINLFTEDDLVRAMSGHKGQRVIVNTIGQDFRNKGPTYRQQRA